MTIKNLYPKARPQTIYNVINGRPELPAASTFSRASTGTYVDANGTIQTAGVDEPRFNYDPETGEFLGLLLEPQRKNIVGYNITFSNGKWVPRSEYITTPNVGISPDGTQNATLHETNVNGTSTVYLQSDFYDVTGSSAITILVGFWAKAVSPNCRYTNFRIQGQYPTRIDVTYDWFEDRISKGAGININVYDIRCAKYPNGWVHLTAYARLTSGNIGPTYPKVALSSSNNQTRIDGINTEDTSQYLWGIVVEKRDELTLNLDLETVPMIYSEGVDASTTTEADAFSLTSSSNFDGGFSLLLDSDTTTDDYFYKIKASGTTIAELNNANGTLDWVVNGVSAATNGEYPRVGAIQPGRVRTVSSFGAADGTTQQNYLYTTGLSFPTNAVVASGADEVEFGPGQTLKAVYLWSGQLSNTEAVSVIKGEYNIVPDEPIKADSYSFVYNTDPENTGATSITLPYIVPTVSMRVYWGDGNDQRYEQGVIPSHTYPYAGQYRIQIEADDGFDNARVSSQDIQSTIVDIDQWAPQYRLNAPGDGFTGDELTSMFQAQRTLKDIPPFKYTNLTSLSSFASATNDLNENGWNWVPTNLTECTSIDNAFVYVGGDDKQERDTFPQFITSSKLTRFRAVFTNCNFTQFVDSNGNPTNRPLTNGTSVTDYSAAFLNCNLTDISLDMQSCTSLSQTFRGNKFVTFPFLDTSKVTTLFECWQKCNNMPTFPQLVTSECRDFSRAWKECSALTSFPLIDTSSGTNFTDTFLGCSGLTSVPSLVFSNAKNLTGTFAESGLTSTPSVTMPSVPFTAEGMFQACSSLNGGSTLDFSNCISGRAAFRNCDLSAGMPPIDAPNNTSLYQTYRGSKFTDVVAMDTSSVETMISIFQYNSDLNDVSELANWDLSSCATFAKAFDICSSLANFPADVFDTTGVLNSGAFDETFNACALTAQSIENILVSLDTNGQSNIELTIDGGTNAGQSTWTAAANTANTNLINKGWTITSNP